MIKCPSRAEALDKRKGHLLDYVSNAMNFIPASRRWGRIFNKLQTRKEKHEPIEVWGIIFFFPSSSLTEVCPAQVRQFQHLKRQVKCHKSPRSSGMAAQMLAAGNINLLLFAPYSSFPRSQPTEQGGNFKQRHRLPMPAPGSRTLGAG